MKTAVEWLVEHLNLDETSPNYNKLIINKAKEMEKEQIINACKQCSYSYEEAEQYYNETFKSE
jgi:heterodisulfide reductase subunit B